MSADWQSGFVERYYAFLLSRISELGASVGEREPGEPAHKYHVLNSVLAGLGRQRQRQPSATKRVFRWFLGRPLPLTEGLVLEFGVFSGKTIRRIAATFPERDVFGFDSFEGFPDDGRTDWQTDYATQGKLPKVPANAHLVKGFFEDTLPEFIEQHPQKVHFMHVDCDLFSSTRTVLAHLRERVVPGTVIVFDELLHYRGFENHEFLAFFLFLVETGLNFEWLGIDGQVMPFDEYCGGGFAKVKGHMAKVREQGYSQAVAVEILDGPPLQNRVDVALLEKAKALAELRPLEQPLLASWLEAHANWPVGHDGATERRTT